MTLARSFGRRVLVSLDAKGYSDNDDVAQRDIQRDLIAIADAAAQRVGLDRSAWDRQPAGDGELSVLPAGVHEPTVVDGFVRELATGLAAHNRFRRDEARLRLRVAIHHGVAMLADNGFAGQGAVVVSRLVEAPPVRQALVDHPTADLVVVLSGQVFTDVVAQHHTSLISDDFREIQVKVKNFYDTAWLRVPGFAFRDVAPPSASATPERPPAPAAQVVNDIHIDQLEGSDIVFGIQNKYG